MVKKIILLRLLFRQKSCIISSNMSIKRLGILLLIIGALIAGCDQIQAAAGKNNPVVSPATATVDQVTQTPGIATATVSFQKTPSAQPSVIASPTVEITRTETSEKQAPAQSTPTPTATPTASPTPAAARREPTNSNHNPNGESNPHSKCERRLTAKPTNPDPQCSGGR